MPSLRDLAILSEAVYGGAGLRLATGAGWSLLEPERIWGDGFAAGRYVKGGELVVAYRGTDSGTDAVADARMVPYIEASAANRTLRGLLELYNVPERTSTNLIQSALVTILSNWRTNLAVAFWGNQVPPDQLSEALEYYDATLPRPVAVTGHSLGGALAKAVSDARNVETVAFNSPFMGDMRGTTQQTSMLITNVNTIGDPLSFLTRAIGNLSHGTDVNVRIRPMTTSPPAVPTVQRRGECPLYLYAVPGAAAGCLGARESRYRYQQGRAEVQYLQELGEYLLDAMLHHHSMENLRVAIETQNLELVGSR